MTFRIDQLGDKGQRYMIPQVTEGVEYVSENGLKPIFDRIWEGKQN